MYLRSLRIYEQKLGSDHLNVSSALNDLGDAYDASEEYVKAEAAFLLRKTCRRAR